MVHIIADIFGMSGKGVNSAWYPAKILLDKSRQGSGKSKIHIKFFSGSSLELIFSHLLVFITKQFIFKL